MFHLAFLKLRLFISKLYYLCVNCQGSITRLMRALKEYPRGEGKGVCVGAGAVRTHIFTYPLLAVDLFSVEPLI